MSVTQTGLFKYTLDTPSDDHAENVRLGYRVPASVLLPPYLYQNPYFVQYTEAIDEVFGPAVDEKIEILKNLRNMWPTDPDLEAQIYTNAVGDDPVMLSNDQWPQFERQIVVKQVNALGMNLQSAGLITDDEYQKISRWVGQYWYGKGTQSFIDFINYCLGTSLTVVALWTQDYKTFVPFNEAGTPIWEGGPWYPTSHVQIEVDGFLPSLSPLDLSTFFYEIANYNLVLQAIDLRFDLQIVTELNQGQTSAAIVAVGMWADNVIVMTNWTRLGWTQPPTYDLSPAFPTVGLVSAGAPVQLMAAPSSWALLDNNKVVPVYSSGDRTVTTGPELSLTVCGPPSALVTVNDYQPLYGPQTWLPMPNAGSRSTARIPGFSTTPTLQPTTNNNVSVQMVGKAREFILCNPDGFADLTGTGYLTPYWNATS